MQKKTGTHKYLWTGLLIFALGTVLYAQVPLAEENQQTETWVSLGPEGGWIDILTQHPSNSNILYAAPYGYPCRIHKSTDKGNTWTELSQIFAYVYDLAIDPNTPSTMYAFYSNRIFKSTDGGLTWDDNRVDNYSFYGGKVDPNNSNLLHAYGRHHDGVQWNTSYFKSTDGGDSWSNYNPLPPNDYSYPYCMKPDPTNSEVAYIAGYYRPGPDNVSFLFRTTNGGTSWVNVASGTDGWIQDIVIDPTSGRVYAISGSGVFRSTNRGDHWDKNNGWAGGYRLALNPNDPNFLIAGDYNRCFNTIDGGVNWKKTTTAKNRGACQTNISDRENTNNVFYGNTAGFFKSTDGGVTWFTSNSGLLVANITALKLIPTTPTTMYIAFDNNAVYKTINAIGKPATPALDIWERLPEFYSCHNIAAFEIPPTNPDHLYAMEGGG